MTPRTPLKHNRNLISAEGRGISHAGVAPPLQQRACKQSQLAVYFLRHLLSRWVHSIFYHQISKRQETVCAKLRWGERLFSSALSHSPQDALQFPSSPDSSFGFCLLFSEGLHPVFSPGENMTVTPRWQGLCNTPKVPAHSEWCLFVTASRRGLPPVFFLMDVPGIRLLVVFHKPQKDYSASAICTPRPCPVHLHQAHGTAWPPRFSGKRSGTDTT